MRPVNSISTRVDSANQLNEDILSYNEAIKLPTIKQTKINQSREALPTYQDFVKEKSNSF